MNTDVIIIGGGLSGLTCGIALLRGGKRVTIIAAGSSMLQFNGGSLDLLGAVGGQTVRHPIEGMALLNAPHPYQTLGAERCRALAREAQLLLTDAGLPLKGDANANHWRLTPLGILKPTWLSIKGMAISHTPDKLPWKQVTLIRLGRLADQPTELVAYNLRRLGANVTIGDVACDFQSLQRGGVPQWTQLLSSNSRLDQLAQDIDKAATGSEVALMPAIVALDDHTRAERLQAQVGVPVKFLATMPPSLQGMRIAALLRHYFKMLGGRLIQGEQAVHAVIDRGSVVQVSTDRQPDRPLTANQYVLAAGSPTGPGLCADGHAVREPIFNLDLTDGAARTDLLTDCGVRVDCKLHPSIAEVPVQNLYAIGAILGGHNPIRDVDGAGVDLITALAAAHAIRQLTPSR